jgi:hypothetical protein
VEFYKVQREVLLNLSTCSNFAWHRIRVISTLHEDRMQVCSWKRLGGEYPLGKSSTGELSCGGIPGQWKNPPWWHHPDRQAPCVVDWPEENLTLLQLFTRVESRILANHLQLLRYGCISQLNWLSLFLHTYILTSFSFLFFFRLLLLFVFLL